MYLHRAGSPLDLQIPPGNLDTALRLSKYFAVSSDLWLGLQADFDLRIGSNTGTNRGDGDKGEEAVKTGTSRRS